jgi:hypothetical protein
MGSTGIMNNPLTQQLLTPSQAPETRPEARAQTYLQPGQQQDIKQNAMNRMVASANAPNPGGSNAYGGGAGPDYFSGNSLMGQRGGGMGGGGLWQPGQGGQGGNPNSIEALSAGFGSPTDLGFYGGPSGGRLPWTSLYQSFDPRLNYGGPGPYQAPNIQHPLLGLLGQYLGQQPGQSAPATQLTNAPPAR